jgi:ParB/RepB/Spo0J family partition protein
MQIQSVLLEKIQPSPNNPRKAELDAELVKSIKDRGILNPLLGRNINNHVELIAGHRRLLAAQKLGLKEVPVVIHDVSDDEALELAIIDNLQREDMPPLEEAAAFARLLKIHKGSFQVVADKVSKTAQYVHQRVQLNSASDHVKKAVKDGQLPIAQACVIVRLGRLEQDKALSFTLKNNATSKQLQSWINENILTKLAGAPWLKGQGGDAFPDLPTCLGCKNRTNKGNSFFSDMSKDDVCLEPTCYAKKKVLFVKGREKELEKNIGEKVQRITLMQSWMEGFDKSALPRNQWREATSECPDQVVALLVDTGNAVTICGKFDKCPACTPKVEKLLAEKKETPAAKEKRLKEQREAKLEREVDNVILGMVGRKSHTRTTFDTLLPLLARFTQSRTGGNAEHRLIKYTGMKLAGSKEYVNVDLTLKNHFGREHINLITSLLAAYFIDAKQYNEEAYDQLMKVLDYDRKAIRKKILDDREKSKAKKGKK